MPEYIPTKLSQKVVQSKPFEHSKELLDYNDQLEIEIKQNKEFNPAKLIQKSLKATKSGKTSKIKSYPSSFELLGNNKIRLRSATIDKENKKEVNINLLESPD